jgi:uncharacterized protein (DUF58 family)
MSEHRTGRWRGVNAVALVLGGVGALAGESALVLAGVFGVGFGALATAARPPEPTVSVERSLSTTDPDPGEPVTVTVRIRNTGDSLLAELRCIDDVPEALAVTEGSPRLATALRPGKAASFHYVVEAGRGVHEFGPARLRLRDPVGAAERRVREGPASELRCVPPLPEPLRLALPARATGVAGRVATRQGGSGVSFHAVREYRRGDPLNRVDWNRLARTGELSTVEFRRERSATVVCLVDAREAAYVAPDPADLSAVDRSVHAAGAVFAGLLAGDDLAGLAVAAPEDCWVRPAAGEQHRAAVRETLAVHPALSPSPPEEPFFGTAWLSRLRRRLPADAQVVFCSPLADEFGARVARRLAAAGHPVTVISPDPTAADTPGDRLVRVERTLRCSSLREAGVRVIDWGEEPLAAAVDRAGRRWSA